MTNISIVVTPPQNRSGRYRVEFVKNTAFSPDDLRKIAPTMGRTTSIPTASGQSVELEQYLRTPRAFASHRPDLTRIRIVTTENTLREFIAVLFRAVKRCYPRATFTTSSTEVRNALGTSNVKIIAYDE